MIWRMWLTGKVGGEYCFWEWESVFSVYTTKDLGDRGWSEEKRCYAVNSKQKSTKNSFLVGSFLTCWLAGPFCRIFCYQQMICRTWLVKKLGGEYCFIGIKCFLSLINQRYGRWGMVRWEEALFVEQLLFSCIFSWGVDLLDHSAKTYSYQWMIWRMWLVEKLGGVYCLGNGDYFLVWTTKKIWKRGVGQKRRAAMLSILSDNQQ